MLALALFIAAAPAQTTPPTGKSAADTVVSAAFTPDIDTTAASPKGEAPAPSATLLLGLVALGVGFFVFSALRRKQKLGGTGIHVIEAASLGDKRSLVIAEVMGERLVLGVSEAGVAVLMSKPAPPPPLTVPAPLAPPSAPRPMGFFARLTGKNPAPAFDAALQESLEDQELRAKLAAGVRSVVP